MGCGASSQAGVAPKQQRGNSLKSKSDKERAHESIMAIPLFRKLKSGDATRLVRAMSSRKFGGKESIVVEGEIGNCFYVVVKGTATVMARAVGGSAGSARTVVLNQLHAGDHFGESAFLMDAPRTASVVADEGGCTCLFVHRDDAAWLLRRRGMLGVMAGRRGAVPVGGKGGSDGSGEAGGASARKGSVPHPAAAEQLIAQRLSPGSREPCPETRALLLAASRQLDLLGLDDEQRARLVDSMRQVDLRAGETLMRKGDSGDFLYCVESGRLAIYKGQSGADAQPSLELGPGEFVGELALLHDAARTATVRAVENTSLWAVSRSALAYVRVSSARARTEYVEHFLSSEVDTLKSVPPTALRSLAEAVEEVEYQPAAAVLRQGEPGDALFFVVSGQARATVREEGDATEVEVARYGPGDLFGERSLLEDMPRAASVFAMDAPLRLLMLPRSSFSLMSTVFKKLRRRQEAYRLVARANTVHGGDGGKLVLGGLRSFAVRDLKPVCVLGAGGFGSVTLMEDKDGEVLAVKAVSKAHVVNKHQQAHCLNERSVWASLSSPFVCRLLGTGRDADFVYFVMEPAMGGSLFGLLRERRRFTEEEARFYVACVVLGIEHMHGHNVLYRDLKPENLMLQSNGYAQIVDLGFAKTVKTRTFSLCGTPDYLAPETLTRSGHSKPVDWWAVGVLAFEMVSSYPPFMAYSQMDVYRNILHGSPQYPGGDGAFSAELRSFVDSLLCKKPVKRLGSLRGASEIKSHPWFRGFDWAALEARTMPAPFPPRLKGKRDVSRFERLSKNTLEMAAASWPAYVSDGMEWDKLF